MAKLKCNFESYKKGDIIQDPFDYLRAKERGFLEEKKTEKQCKKSSKNKGKKSGKNKGKK